MLAIEKTSIAKKANRFSVFPCPVSTETMPAILITARMMKAAMIDLYTGFLS
jgi:hypothetical protein